MYRKIAAAFTSFPVSFFERSAAARDPKGMAAFGDALLCGWGGPQNTALGLVMASQAAELGSDLGAYILGQAFFKGQWGLAKESAVNQRHGIALSGQFCCSVKHEAFFLVTITIR